ncbi:MAG TPA: VOC family protein [Opitutaceae bacterium]
MKPESVMESVLYAHDLVAAEEFYTRVMHLEVIARDEGRHVFFRCGRGVLLVFNPVQTSSEKTYVGGSLIPLHGTTGGGHLAFRARADELADWRRHLQEKGIAIESEVSWPQGGHSIYVRDPAGNSVELVTPEVWAQGRV